MKGSLGEDWSLLGDHGVVGKSLVNRAPGAEA